MAGLFDTVLSRIPVYEGFRAAPYQDTRGKWTIGMGTRLKDGFDPAMRVTEDQAKETMTGDLSRIMTSLDAAKPAWRQYPPETQEALLDMAYNMGTSGLMKFEKMFAALDAGDAGTAAAEVRNSNYFTQVGNRARENAARVGTGK